MQVALRKAKGRGQQGRLLLGYLLLAKQKEVTAPPGAIPAPGKKDNKTAKNREQKTQPQPITHKHHQTQIQLILNNTTPHNTAQQSRKRTNTVQ